MSRAEQLQQIEIERAATESLAETGRVEQEEITQTPYAIISQETNPIRLPFGLSGSLTQLVDGSSYLIQGNNVEISSASNGPITISAPNLGITLSGNDGEVQFNDGGSNTGRDPNFTFNATSKTLSVTNLSSSLTRLSDNTPYLIASGLVSLSTGSGAVTVTRSLSDDISNETWKSFTPEITATPTPPTLPSDIVSIGKYIYSSGTMKLIFSLSSRVTAGALGGSGTYIINMPSGYEVDTAVVPLAAIEAPLEGISLAAAGLALDVTGGGGAWSVVPVSSSQLILVGKAPSDTAVHTWGSSKFPFGSGADYRVHFTATFPAKLSTLISANWQGPDVQLDGGTFTVTAPTYEDWTGPNIQLTGGTWPEPTASQYMTLGTIFVEGSLTFNPGTNINLYQTVFYHPGTYVLFDYSAPGASFVNGSSQLANVTVTCVDLPSTISTNPVLTDDTTNKRILLTLPSNPTNGKIFVEGNLTFSGATTMTLSKKLYATPGTYELFDFSGTSSGVTDYLTCVSLAGFVCGNPYVEGNLVKVTLT